MEYFEIINITIFLFILVGLAFVFVGEIRDNRKMMVEREECFLMIARCSRIIRLLKKHKCMTNNDFAFLKNRIHKSYIRIHYLPIPLEDVSSERERRILADGLHWMSVEEKCGELYHKNKECKKKTLPYQILLDMATVGFSGFPAQENKYEGLEWACYMRLTGMSIYALDSQAPADWRKLKHLCFTIEKWITDGDIDSYFLKNKIKECRSQITAMRHHSQ